ncbi:hypothetical protein C8F01DRAFT_1160533 [Mycena amicta]|nr:hypothetical protein C8F01DRAFT_1160533 [Mycena amicta]
MPSPLVLLARGLFLRVVESLEWTIRFSYPQSSLHVFLRHALRISYTAGLYCFVLFDLVYMFTNCVLSPLADPPLDTRETKRPSGRHRVPVPAWQLITVFGGLPLNIASILREQGSTVVEGTYPVIRRVVLHSVTALTAALTFAFLLALPLLMVWIVVRRLTVEPYKHTWTQRTARTTRLCARALFVLLTFEWLAIVDVPLLRVVGVSKWLGLTAFTAAGLWFFCDRTAAYFLRKAVVTLTLPRKPYTVSPHNSSSSDHWVHFMLSPATLVFNAYVYTATTASAGIASAFMALACATGLAFSIVALDILIYWMYFRFRVSPTVPSNSTHYSTTERMAVFLAEFSVRDGDGRTTWDKDGREYRLEVGMVFFEAGENGRGFGQIFGAGEWILVAKFTLRGRKFKRL